MFISSVLSSSVFVNELIKWFCSAKRSSVQTCVGDMVSSTVSSVLESSATQKGFEKANLVSGTSLPSFFFFFFPVSRSLHSSSSSVFFP